tara:strand:- start:215 stop:400 length:186 start_codon:yes stop_codon:yes gene_type:complete
MNITILSILFLLIAICLIGIKIILKKDGQFSGTCSSNNPLLKSENGSCGICGAKPEDKCKN